MARKEFDVSLVVLSNRLSLSELTSSLGCQPESGSHDRNEMRPTGAPWQSSLLRMNASDPDAPLETQCKVLLDSVPSQFVELLSAKSDEISGAYLDIATYFRTAYCSVTLSSAIVRRLSDLGIGLEITTYPCSVEDQ